MGEFSFGSLIAPGDAVRSALKRDLEIRAQRGHPLSHSGLYYPSAFTLLLKHGRWWNGAPLPDNYSQHIGMEGGCYGNALAAAEADPSLTYVEGYYLLAQEASMHAWCMDPAGRILELTAPTRGRVAGFKATDGNKRPTGGRIPWVPPERWAYVGLPWETSFVRAINDDLGLPILDPFGQEYPGYPFSDHVLRQRYTPAGFDWTTP